MQRDNPPPGPPESAELTLDEAMRLGVDLHRRGSIDEAKEIYRRVLALEPEHASALHFLGMAEHQSGHTLEGLRLLARCVARYPEYADAHNNLGNVLRQIGNLDAAAAAYERALGLRADDASALSNLAAVRRLQGRLDEALSLLQRVLALVPDHAQAHQNLGNVLSSLDRFDEALDAYQTALARQPYDGDSHRELGSALASLGRIEEAVAVYRKWCALEPNNPEALHMLASCSGEGVPSRASDATVRELFNRAAESFDQLLVDRLKYRAPQLIEQAIAGVLGQREANALDVLDLGCGTGLCARFLRHYARRLTGVDLSAGMLERAAERTLYDALENAELTQYLRAHPASFDLMVAADVLVYFGELDEFARAAASALRTRGVLTFTLERSPPDSGAPGFRIYPHGRYSHTEAYVQTVLVDAGLLSFSIEHAHLRVESGKRVDGMLVVAKKPA